MAGHSKWANIQHRKSKQDAKRGKLFTKLIREITVSARMGGGDASANPRLRAAIDAALANNMTKDTIERAVKRGAGGGEGDNVEEIRYEGYGPGGTAIIVDCMSDNRNRTVAEVRHTFNKYGGNLGTDGSVAYLFNECGVIYCQPGNDEDQLLAVALEAGADDIVNNDDGSVDVVTSFAGFHAAKSALEKAGIAIDSSETTMRAATSSRLDLDNARSLITLVDMLEDLDDVQRVYSNADIPQDILEQLG